MFDLTGKQVEAIEAFNASKTSVTEFVDAMKEGGLVVEELCPTPVDLNMIRQSYNEAEYLRLHRKDKSDYGSHTALQVIVLSRKVGKATEYCVVRII